MSRCEIVRTVRDGEAALALAKRETEARGGTFEGTLERGRYVMKTPLGPVEGTYEAKGNEVRFLVEKKPMVVPCALIGTILDQFLSKE